MDRTLYQGETDPRAELRYLLDYNGFAYRDCADGCIRLSFSDRGCKWETVCVCAGQTVVFYGVYPFPAVDEKQALRLCGEVNKALASGCLFTQDGRLVMRTSADVFDAYTAYEAIGRALEYNSGAVVEYWRQLSAGTAEGAQYSYPAGRDGLHSDTSSHDI